MSCIAMLERMLDAAPEELVGRGDSALAAHLRECPRCRAVADQLIADTRALAQVVESREPRALPRRIPRALWRAGALVTSLAAAALAFALLRPAGEPVVVAPPQATVNVPGPTAASVAPVAIAPTRYPDAVATAPVPVVPVEIASSTPRETARATDHQIDITVTPAAGLRAAIIRTSNPNITVVWLY